MPVKKGSRIVRTVVNCLRRDQRVSCNYSTVSSVFLTTTVPNVPITSCRCPRIDFKASVNEMKECNYQQSLPDEHN